MFMNGEILTDLNDLKRCFSIDELLYATATANWKFFLKRSASMKKQNKFRKFPKTTPCC